MELVMLAFHPACCHIQYDDDFCQGRMGGTNERCLCMRERETETILSMYDGCNGRNEAKRKEKSMKEKKYAMMRQTHAVSRASHIGGVTSVLYR